MSEASRTPSVRVTSLLRNRTWLALAPTALLAFGLAYWGFGQLDSTLTEFERVERSAQLLKGSGAYNLARSPWQLVVAQWLMPLVALLTAAKLFLASLRRDLRVAFANRSRDHVIVCGLGSTGRRVVEIMRARGDRVLAIDLDSESANARAAESLGAPTIAGDAKTSAVLRLAGVRRAKAIVACTGDDTANLEIALTARDEGTSTIRFGQRLLVVPEMRADWLFERFVGRSSDSLGSEKVEFRILNIAESAGRLLCRAPAFAACAVLRPSRTDLAIVGFGDMGRAIVAQSIRTAFAVPGRRMRFHVFDARGDAASAGFESLYPGVGSVADVDTCEAKIAAAKPESWMPVQTRLAAARMAAVVVCLPDDGEALYAATRAREALDAQDDREIPVFVRVSARRKLAEVLSQMDTPSWFGDRIIPFGDTAELLSAGLVDVNEDVLARACHDAYLATLQVPSDLPSNRAWDALPELFKRSNRLFADHLEVKLRAAGLRSCPADAPRDLSLSKAELDDLAEVEHWRWLAERRLAGWSYGQLRDDANLRHPLMLAWADLPMLAQDGVRTVVARIPAILARVGREIRRERPINEEGALDALEGYDPGGDDHIIVSFDPRSPRAEALLSTVMATPHVSLRINLEPGSGSAAFVGFDIEAIRRLRDRIDGVPERSKDFDAAGN